MKLTLRFLVLVAALLLAVGASTVAGWRALDRLDAALQRVVDQDMQRLLSITHARRVFRSMVVLERDFILAKADEERAAMSTRMGALGTELSTHLDRYARSMPPEDAPTVLAIRGARLRWIALHEKVRAAALQGQDEALALAKQHSKDPVLWELAIGGLVKSSETRLTEQVANTHVTYARAKSTLVLVSILAGALASGLGSLIFLGIRRTMLEVVALNGNLEALVQARTQALFERERSLRLVLDSTGDALIGIELNGDLNGECSAAAEAWFGKPRMGSSAGGYLFPQSEDHALNFELGLSQLAEGYLPWELAVDQLPKRIVVDARTLELEYKPVHGEGALLRFLLIARDVTARIQHEASECTAREQQAMIGKLLSDKSGFEQFVKDCEELFARLSSEPDLSNVKRELHTLKGNAAVFGLSSLAEQCHALEDRVAVTEELPTAANLAHLAMLFRSRLQSIETFLTGVRRDVLQVEREQHQTLVTSLLKRQDYDEILRTVELWSWPRTSERLGQLRAQAEYVAKRLGKELEVSVEHNDLRIPPGYMDRVWSVAVHAIRNAVDHGIEPPEQREQVGKPRKGRLALTTRYTSESLILEIEDDGAGIDWPGLVEVARRRGIEGVPAEQLPFLEGVSSRSQVSDLSGRGVGLSALQHACLADGGTIEVTSTRGRGTTLTLTFPRPVVELGALAEEMAQRWSRVPRSDAASSGTLPVALRVKAVPG